MSILLKTIENDGRFGAACIKKMYFASGFGDAAMPVERSKMTANAMIDWEVVCLLYSLARQLHSQEQERMD